MRKLTTDEFVSKSISKHGNRYDYTRVNYIGNKSKVLIICKIHGEFEQQPNNHLFGKGCSKCAGKEINTNEFIERSNEIHSKKYDYTLVKYINSTSNVKIVCKIHGVFEQKPKSHFRGKGCPKCAGKGTDTNDFIEKSIRIHNNKYDYTLVNYIRAITKVKIVCKIHGVFEQQPNNHLSGQGCSKCVIDVTNTLEFIKKSNDIHNSKYDYSLTEYIKTNIKVKIICKIHGVFEQLPLSHLKGKGCSKCVSSKGEEMIMNILSFNNIDYISQKTFTDCKNVLPLPFDFYLPEQNICIEFDGKQHFEPIEWFGGSDAFESLKERDEIKNKFCLSNNIDLLRIAYYDYDNIEHIIRSKINI